MGDVEPREASFADQPARGDHLFVQPLEIPLITTSLGGHFKTGQRICRPGLSSFTLLPPLEASLFSFASSGDHT